MDCDSTVTLVRFAKRAGKKETLIPISHSLYIIICIYIRNIYHVKSMFYYLGDSTGLAGILAAFLFLLLLLRLVEVSVRSHHRFAKSIRRM